MAKTLPRDNRTSPQPNRSFMRPGGPYASGLGEVEVKRLAEIVRGGPDDNGVGVLRDLDDRDS